MTNAFIDHLSECFGDLPDPRVQGRCDYPLLEILVIAICGALCGAEGWTDIELIGKAKEGWLRQFLPLEHGIPSHDTFGDVFAKIEAEAFQQCFIRWVEWVFRVTKGQVVAVDGKTLCGSHDRGIGKEAIHMVSAWASANRLILGQRKTDAKSNEITAIPELLDLLQIEGCTVTIDAMGCQTKIAQKIRERGADYLLCVKDNQKQLKEDIAEWFAYADEQGVHKVPLDFHCSIHKTSGRVEIRKCWVVSDPKVFDYIRHYQGWTDLNSIIRVERERRTGDKVCVETAYYISSLATDAKTLLEATQHHWSIENSFHWVLDVIFREDDSRIRSGDSAANMAVLRAIAMNLLKRDTSKNSLRQKRLRAGLDNDFLFHLLTGI